MKLNRRSFVKFTLLSGAMSLFPGRVWSAIDDADQSDRFLSLYNPNSKDVVSATYWSNGSYIPSALEEINHFMRDRLTGRQKPIDTKLIDLLYHIRVKLNTERTLYVISGYRSPEANARLEKRGRPVAKNSYHLKGKAVDVYLPGYKLSALRRASVQCRGGGVGYYPRSRFVHVDVGPIRYWSGR
jgi:uncharacterized protein YcbK (DUF882 family)